MDLPITFILAIVFALAIWLSYKLGSAMTNLRWKNKIPQLQKLTADRQRSTIKGKLTETFAPFLPGFPFKPSECKFLGDPIDFVAFEGLDERNVKGVHFVEVKDANSKLSKHQKQIKDLIDKLDSDEVTFKEYRKED